jgi:phage shock protein PspC (stress-responsive transcriptional regulator)
MKKLFRSKTDRKLAGVCGGLAMYFGIDSSVVRLIWALVTFFSIGIPGIIVYIICALVIPDEPNSFDSTARYTDNYNNNVN